MRLRPFTLSLLLASASLAVHADDDAGMDTDRPDFVESSNVVGSGHWQIEAGLTSDRYRQGGASARTVTTPTLVRIGLGSTTELRIETDGIARVHATDAGGATSNASGFSDTALGIKWHTQDDDGWQPSLAWLLHVDTPSGSAEFRGRGLRPSLRMVAEWDLPDEWSLGVMPGVFVDSDDTNDRYVASLLAVTLGKEFTRRWRGFLEVAGQQFASERDGGNVVTLDVGVAWLATPDVQLDLNAARGLTDAAPRAELGVGISIRF